MWFCFLTVTTNCPALRRRALGTSGDPRHAAALMPATLAAPESCGRGITVVTQAALCRPGIETSRSCRTVTPDAL